MSYKVVLRGSEPSGRFLALLCARTGKTIEMIRKGLASEAGFVLGESLTGEGAQALVAALPEDGSVAVSVKQDIDTWMAVLVGYRPGSRGRLRSCLQRLSGLSTEEVIHFLSSIPIALKSGIDRKTANAVKDIIERDGGIIEIRPQTGLMSVKGTHSRKTAVMEKSEASQDTDASESKLPNTEADLTGRNSRISPMAGSVQSSEGNTPLTPRIDFSKPGEVGDIPPAVSEQEEYVCIPHVFSFAIPASAIPPSVDPSGKNTSAPPVTQTAQSIPVYLHPVSENQRKDVTKILIAALGLSGARAEELVFKAPSTVCLFRKRKDALAMLRKLSDSGAPVSLVHSEYDTGKPSAERTTFFGWLNGTG